MSEMNTQNQGDLASDGSQTGAPRQGRRSNSLQRRVQNALRWRSWGGESDTAGPSTTGAYPPARPAAASQGRQRGRSAGSDVELSALPSTSSIGSGISASAALDAGSSSGAPGSPAGDPLLLDSMHGGVRVLEDGMKSISSCTVSSAKSSSTGSATGRAPSHDSNSLTGQLGGGSIQQQHPPGSSAASAAGDDVCSVATQAGSAVHSFTSLHSMLLDHGEGSDAGTTGPAAAAAAAASPTGPGSLVASSYRGSDAGADVATSVSTLPLISEAAYDDEDGQVLGFDEGSENGRELYNPQRGSDTGGDGGPNSRHRVSSSSMTSLNSEVSGSAAGAGAAGAAAIRIPSPGFNRPSARGSSGSRYSLQQQLQQQQQQQTVVLQQQEPSHSSSSMDLPLPFSTRKRPENDDTCSYATQAGSVHSVSSVMSAMFMDSNAPSATSSQRQLPGSGSGSASAAAGQAHGPQSQPQQYVIHPLSEPDEFEHLEDLEDADEERGGSSSSSPRQHHHQQQQQLGRVIGEAAIRAAPLSPGGESGAGDGPLERKGSLKGALRSVVAWGSGLGHKLQRASNSITHPHSHSHKQHRAHQGGGGGSSSSAAQGRQGSKQRGAGSGQEMANM